MAYIARTFPLYLARSTLPRMRIYLTGFMGSGKSTVGRQLATDLHWPFVDTDDWIEEEIGVPISEYFAQEGEAAFRKREADALVATGAHRRAVVSTGGGMLVNTTRMQHALQLGTVVYLRVSVDALCDRLAPVAGHRPLLWDANGHPLEGGDLHTRISHLLDERQDAYQQASFCIPACAAPGVVAQRICRTLSLQSA